MKIRDLFGEYLNPKKKEIAAERPAARSMSAMEECLVEGILGEFSDIAVFDTVEDMTIMIRRQGRPIESFEQVTRYYYESIWDRYIKRNVVPEERDQVRRRVELSTVMSALDGAGRYSVLYHIENEQGKQCYQVLFFGVDDSHILIGFRNVDALEEAILELSGSQDTSVPAFREHQAVTLNESAVHLPDTLHEVRTRAQSYINAKRLDLSMDSVDVVNEDVFCDGRHLADVLECMLEHASRDTRPGGSISVRIKQNQQEDHFRSEYMFMIRHEGNDSGIPVEVEQMVKLMGGTVSASANGENKVAASLRFSFRNAGSPVKHEPIPALQGLRALVVDNDMNTCFSVSKMLSSIGMRADWIGSGDEAVLRTRYAIEQDDEYHAFIMDWMISDMNGLETIRKIRNIIGDTKPIILLTAYDWPDIESAARHAGVTAFCSKPLFMSELQDVLTQPYKVVRTERDEVSFEGKRVLLAEDNELNLELTAELLSEAGFEVEAAGDGMQAVDMVRDADSGYYDLILMDIQMPTMNGYEASKLIRKLEDRTKAEVPIIAMTANFSRDDEQKVLAAGMDRYLTKPVDIHRLLEVYRELMA